MYVSKLNITKARIQDELVYNIETARKTQQGWDVGKVVADGRHQAVMGADPTFQPPTTLKGWLVQLEQCL